MEHTSGRSHGDNHGCCERRRCESKCLVSKQQLELRFSLMATACPCMSPGLRPVVSAAQHFTLDNKIDIQRHTRSAKNRLNCS